jgi:hypothetical protein
MAMFVGGPLDGKLIEVDAKRDSIEVAIEHPITETQKKPNKLTDIFFYKKEIIECPTAQFIVFVPRTYTCTDTLTALIQGYHRDATQNT